MLIAQMLRKRYRIEGVPTDEQLAAMLVGEGVDFADDLPSVGNLRELYVDGIIALRSGLPREWRRWLMAHGLIHHLCHSGNQIVRVLNKAPIATLRRQEREADYVAGTVFWNHLLSPAGLSRGATPLSVWELAELAEVPVSKVIEWREIAALLPQGGEHVGAFAVNY